MASKRGFLRGLLKVGLPLVVMAVAGLSAAVLVWLRPEPPVIDPQPVVEPIVDVEVLRPVEADRLHVRSQGQVRAKRRTTLASQVGGRVESVSANLVQGGFFREGEVLVQIERADFLQALAQARQVLANAELALEEEELEAGIAVREWERLGREGEPPTMVARKPHIAARKAAVAAAEEAVARAERDLARTTVRAPYDGRVQSYEVDAGEVIAAGEPLAELFSTDVVEVPLPIDLVDVELLGMALDVEEAAQDGAPRMIPDGPTVTLSLPVGPVVHRWRGRIVRSEGRLDERTRTLNVVARVERPHENVSQARLPLLAGMFVDAVILGREVEHVFVVPRAAVRNRNEVLLVTPLEEAPANARNPNPMVPHEEAEPPETVPARLEFRTVEVLTRTIEALIVSAGLKPGEWMVVSPVPIPVDGMRVRARLVGETATSLGEGER